MNRRRWLVFIAAALASVAFLDVALWAFTTRALQQAVQAWTQRQRANGVDVAIGPLVAGGWPWAATVRFDAKVGPAGLPGRLVVAANLTVGLSPTRPRIVRTRVDGLQATAPGGQALTAAAASWLVDTPIADPDRSTMTTQRARLAWANHDVTIASLIGAMAPAADGGIRIAARAADIDLANAGVVLPAASGRIVRSLDLDATLFGGLPRPAETAFASAQAWRQGGGRIDLTRADLAFGPLDLAVDGKLGLDEALRPVGSGAVDARGLVPWLQDLANAGLVPPHAAQAAAGVLALLGAASGGPMRIPVDIADDRVALAGIPLLRLPTPPWLDRGSLTPPDRL